MTRGSLIVVGTGMMVSNQCTLEARDHIENADIVFEAVGDVLAQKFVRSLNANVVSLQPMYGQGRSRSETYRLMIETILEAVRAGKQVCAAFYGHPGVYVFPSHESIRRARSEGYEAKMLPAVSADACLYADLGLDPGWTGCQSFDATDFIINAPRFDTSATLILWQIALAGDRSLRVFESESARLALLGEVLMDDYPADHLVMVYTAATLPMMAPRQETLELNKLELAHVTQELTLHVPPAGAAKPSPQRLALVAARLGVNPAEARART